MDDPKQPIELTEEEIKNRKYYKTLANLNILVMLIHIIIFYLLFNLIIYITSQDTTFIEYTIYFITGYIILFTSGWLLSLPVRYWMYCVCKKHGLMQQELKPWLKDWSKLLLVNLLIYVPFLSLATLIFYYNFDQGEVALFVQATVFLLLFVCIQTVRKFVSMWFIHGLYLLNSGEKYTFWSNLAKEKNVKIYPIWVLSIASKVTFNNAFAMGFKNPGFILMTDCLLNNLPQKQISAILAHETAHLIKNDILKRLLCVIIAVAGCYFVFSDLLNIDTLERLALYVLVLLGFILIIFYMARQQEYQADKYAANLLGDPLPMVDALEYLYKANKYPVSSKKNIRLKLFSLHPSFEDRKKRLLNTGK